MPGKFHSLFAITLVSLAIPRVSSPTEAFAGVQLESGDQQIALLELYTSEGCSSCPPADAWLTSLKTNSRLWKDFVPIALHVDYWNYIGWTDRFARADYSERQRAYVRNGGARVAYTPGFFSNGQEWRGWFSGEALDSQRATVGNLILGVDGSTVAVRFDPRAEMQHLSEDGTALMVNIAILGMGLQTEVRAGENHGKVLQHDFVTLHLQSIPLEVSDDGYKVITNLAEIETETNDLALVAWVSSLHDQRPIQAVGGHLTPPD